MGFFREKALLIEARRWPGAVAGALSEVMAFDAWLADKGPTCKYRGADLVIPTLEGEMTANPGDWVIVGVKGELYPCKPDIFEATYEAVGKHEFWRPGDPNCPRELKAGNGELHTMRCKQCGSEQTETACPGPV